MNLARRQALTPDALQMMDTIARAGSFAAAARELGRVPSALTYSVRQLEEALDVLLFDRRSRQAQLTAAGEELLAEGRRLLAEMDAVANRVRRVATGWESELTLACDTGIASAVVLELVQAFFEQRTPDGQPPGTRLRLRHEVMAGTWEALTLGQADLGLGVVLGHSGQTHPALETEVLGDLPFLFLHSPHHPLAAEAEPLSDEAIFGHRAIAVADSAQRLSPLTFNLLPGQDVLTVPSLAAKIDALARGLGCGFAPEPMARAHLQAGRLVARQVQRSHTVAHLGYAWRRALRPERHGGHGGDTGARPPVGLALQWWLQQLASPTTRRALLAQHGACPWLS